MDTSVRIASYTFMNGKTTRTGIKIKTAFIMMMKDIGRQVGKYGVREYEMKVLVDCDKERREIE